MSTLAEELDKMSTPDKVLRTLVPAETFQQLTIEDQQALRDYFMVWAKADADIRPGHSLNYAAGLIALGFLLGHNWVKDHWTLW